jgi:hypothetical protein
MTRILFALILLSPTPTQSSAVNIPDAIRAAYEMGKQDAMFEADDIGLVRLTINDINQLLGEI